VLYVLKVLPGQGKAFNPEDTQNDSEKGMGEALDAQT
jgi:hypothetical protein